MAQGTFLGGQTAVGHGVMHAMGRCVLAVLLFLNIAMGAMLPGRALNAAELGSRMEICTAAGMVSIDPSGQASAPAGGTVAHESLCVFCLPLFHGAGLVPVAAAALLAVPAPGMAAFTEPSFGSVTHARLAGAIGPRAPPSL